MTTAVISDLHLGKRGGGDLLRAPAARRALFARTAEVDELVLLGDVVELRDGRAADALEAARPFLAELGDAFRGRKVVIVPGNHDHQLVAPWYERRRLDAQAPPLALADAAQPAPPDLAARVGELISGPELAFSYPGYWIDRRVYATHGHYLDLHNAVPALEPIAVSLSARLRRHPAPESLAPDDYEAMLAPVYALAYRLAQAARPRRSDGPSVSFRLWERLNGEGRPDIMSVLLRGVGLPAAVGAMNRLGLGPFEADLSRAALGRAALDAMGTVVARLGIRADHVIFGHTHRSGPMDDEEEWTLADGTGLMNCGNWVHEPTFIGDRGTASPHWPGTCAIVDEGRAPRLECVIDGLP